MIGTLVKFLSISSCTGNRSPWSVLILFALPLRGSIKCRLGSIRIQRSVQRSVQVAASNSSISDSSEKQGCGGKDEPMDSISL